MLKATPFQLQLLTTYGDSAVDVEKSHVLIKYQQIYMNQPTDLLVYFDLRNKYGLRVSSLPPSSLISRLTCYIDSPPRHQQLVMLETTRPGFVHTQFTYEQPIPGADSYIRIYYCEKLIVERLITAKDSWVQSNKAVFQDAKIISHSQSIFYSNRILFNGLGEFSIQLSEASLIGLCLKEQRSIIYGQTIGPGLVQIVADGKSVSLICQGETKVVDGIDGRDCVAFVRLRPSKSAEFM
ncbi:Conserved_hypothetical protein [Hexamita inflata]|uniref:Uncharacterized protein n=1 Tax=Hexamita inflata TaxID=28002 RepID=A0AA86U1E8_9EUKA|nr:Conserved hypothetical protein [Hexamita inflata]CAI9934786.1 Conserved hypothetical protein [Hexamita inflata]